MNIIKEHLLFVHKLLELMEIVKEPQILSQNIVLLKIVFKIVQYQIQVINHVN